MVLRCLELNLNYSRISFCDYFAKVIQVFGDNAKVGTCFALGSFFRDIIVNKLGFSPIFNIFGPKGSGKTQLGTSLMGLVIREHKPTSLGTATLAALAEEVAFSSNAPLHLDEYKNEIGFWKIEWLKDMWGGIGRSRMSLDKDKRRKQSRVDCALIITGQEIPTADIALFTRLIFVSCDKQHHTILLRLQNYTDNANKDLYGFRNDIPILLFCIYRKYPTSPIVLTYEEKVVTLCR